MMPINLSFRLKGEILSQCDLGKACLRTKCRQVHQLLNAIIEELLACACAEGRHAGRNETLAA